MYSSLVVYARDPYGALYVLTKELFASWDGFTGEQRWMIAELVERAAGPTATRHPAQQVARSWLPTRFLDELTPQRRGHNSPDQVWRLIHDHPAERDRVLAVFANRPDWAPLIAHYLAQRHLALLALAPNPRVSSEAVKQLAQEIEHAETELHKIIEDMRLSRKDHRQAHSELKRALKHYWSNRALDYITNYGNYEIRIRVKGLAVAAHLAGSGCPNPS